MSTEAAPAPTQQSSAPPPPAKSEFMAKLESAMNEAAQNPVEEGTEAPIKKEAPKPKAEAPDKAEKAEPKKAAPDALFEKPGDAKPEAKTAEKTSIDEIAEPVFKNEKDKAGWKALKEAASAAERRAAELERSINDRKNSGKDAESLERQLAEKEAKLAEYSELVARARIETHPEFRKEFIDGRKNLVSKAKSIIEESDGDAAAVEIALNLQGKPRVEALREIASGLDNFQSGRLGRVIDELNDLDSRAAEKLEKSQQSYAEIQETERRREIESKANLAKEIHMSFDQTTRSLRSEIEVLNKVDGNDEWNAKSDAIVNNAREFVENNTDLNASIQTAIKAQAMPVYRDLFLETRSALKAEQARANELESELKQIHSKGPSLANRGGNQSSLKDSKRPFMDTLRNALGEE